MFRFVTAIILIKSAWSMVKTSTKAANLSHRIARPQLITIISYQAPDFPADSL